MDTLCGQAYGAKNYPMIGVVMQRAMLINALVAIPIVLLWTRMSGILVWLGQSADIAPLAAKYMLLSLPQLFCSIVTTGVEKFQTTQNIMKPVTLINLGILSVCPLVFWLFTRVMQWGLLGAAMANNVTSAATMLGMLCSAVWIHNTSAPEDGKRQAWSGFTPDAFKVRAPALTPRFAAVKPELHVRGDASL